MTVFLIPFAIYLFVPGRFNWWLALLYMFVSLRLFLDRFILMLHNTSHRKLYKRKYKFLNHYIPWVLGPLCGETPDTYYAHHVGMHHPENNLEDDLSSTLRYQRDSFLDFMTYFLRFFFGIIFELTGYFVKRNRFKLIRSMLVGEFTYYIVVGALLWFNWRAALVVFVIPFCFTRFMMMAGNWGQHAFVDASDPGNCYRNSITTINCLYNRRCFNDGYHISHHLKPNRHWTDHPIEYEENLQKYAEEDAIVFEGIDFFIVWLFLMLKRYDWLADRYVQLREEHRTKEEIIALLKERASRTETLSDSAATAA
jgi:fatty acid desaturase